MGFQYFETDARGHLPVGTDIAAVLRHGDERPLYAAWNTYGHLRLLRETLAQLDAGTLNLDDPDASRAALQRDIDSVAALTPAQALEANRRLVEFLTGRRWSVMQEAREAGDSWTVIGDALGVTKQGALDWYKRKIADQEKYVGKFHDTDRARAVVDEQE
ncbi:hypothetical protein [Nocardia fusca]|uniref:hypothetical protein n=1 Tax=Nocardia fusca TaxID=941183 RepID=UPI0007A7598E|nr:hypothetical protein [Nocardia fusca]